MNNNTVDDDLLLMGFITSARQLAEKYTARAFFTQQWRLSLDRFPMFWGRSTVKNITDQSQFPFDYFWQGITILLPKPKLVSVDSITYVDPTYTTQTLDPTTYYVDPDSEPGRVCPTNNSFWPTPVSIFTPGGVKISFTTGSYGDGVTVNTCPQNVCTAISLLAAHWYTSREGAVDIPKAFYTLLDPEKFVTFSYTTY